MGKSSLLVATRSKTLSDLSSIIIGRGEGISFSFRKRPIAGSFGSKGLILFFESLLFLINGLALFSDI